MGLVIGMGFIGILAVSLLLSYLTSFEFWQSTLTIFALIGGLIAINAMAAWIQDQQRDSNTELTQQTAPDDALPTWSHSRFANTKAIKLSPDTPTRHLDPDHPFDQEGFHGYSVSYPNSNKERFFINQNTLNEEEQFVRELRYWSGAIDQLSTAPQLRVDGDATGMEAFGIDEDWTLLRVEYFHTHLHQLYLLDHRNDTLTALTERLKPVSASKGLMSDFHYYTAVSQEPKQLLLTLYSREKNYDSFFSARGHYLPRDSKVYLITEAEPTTQLIAHLRLHKEGAVVGLEQKGSLVSIHSFDEREHDQPITRHWTLSLNDKETSDSP